MNTSPPSVFDRPLSLAKALREAAEIITAPDSPYKWTDSGNCNCGILASVLLGRKVCGTEGAQKMTHPKGSGPWGESGYYCHVTGLTEGGIIKELFEAGLQPLDLYGLENLDCPEIGEYGAYEFAQPAQVSSYMLRWATGIEKFQAEHDNVLTDEQMEKIERRELVGVAMEVAL